MCSTLCFYSIGNVLSLQGKPEEALAMHQQSLNIKLKVFCPDHPLVADTQYNIGIVLKNQGEFAQALKMYGKCLKTREKVLGTDHPATAMTHNNIGSVYVSRVS